MYEEQLSYVLDMIRHLDKSPLPDNPYFKAVVVLKGIDSDTSLGSVSKDELGQYLYNI